MPRVFKQQYTRPIPADAMRTTGEGQGQGGSGRQVQGQRRQVRRGTSDEEWRPLPGSISCLVWPVHRCRRPVAGRVPLCENKAAAEMMLNDKIKEAEQAKALGLSSQTIDARKRP